MALLKMFVAKLDIENNFNFELYDNISLLETNVRIYKLIRKIIKKEIIVPRIIRSIVWDKEKAKKFIRFLFKGLPSGRIIVWQLSNKSPNLKHYRTIIKSEYQLPDEVNLILDGLQRCTAIAAVFSEWDIIIDKRFQNIDLYYNFITDRFMFKNEIKRWTNNWINLKETCNLTGDNSKEKEIFMKKYKPVLDELDDEKYVIVKKRIERIFGLVNKTIEIDEYHGLNSNLALEIIRNSNMSNHKKIYKFN